MMITHSDLIVVEFSLSQKAFNKQFLKDMVKQNLINVFTRKQNDYIPIGVFKSNDVADGFIDSIRDKIKDYSMYKSTEGNIIVS